MQHKKVESKDRDTVDDLRGNTEARGDTRAHAPRLGEGPRDLIDPPTSLFSLKSRLTDRSRLQGNVWSLVELAGT